MDLSIILEDWPYDEEHEANNIRKVVGIDGRLKVQVRLRHGVIQWEAEGRPDGVRPYGFETTVDYCENLLTKHVSIPRRRGKSGFRLDYGLMHDLRDEICQYRRRRAAFMKIGDFSRALKDAEQHLRALALIRNYCRDGRLVFELDRRRPRILLDRARSEAFLHLQQDQAEQAVQALNRGIWEIEQFLSDYGEDSDPATSKERNVLIDLRRSIRERYDIPLTDQELLDTLRAEQQVAIKEQNYEMAARLRDKINSILARLGKRGWPAAH